MTYPGAVTWKDSLVYLIGGYDVSHTARTEVYYYDPATNSWVSATSLPRALQGGGVRIKGDSIYIVGGADGYSYYSEILLGEINPADPSEISWSWGDSLPIPENARNGFAIKNNKLFMIGGAFDMGINEAWEYDIPSGTWASLPDYPTNCLLRDNMAERRDGPDSSGIIYCFMGDTSDYSMMNPTDKCYRLIVSENDAGMYAINSPVSDTTIESFVHVNGTVKNYGGNTYSFASGVNIYDPDQLVVFTQAVKVEDLPPSGTLNIDFGSFELTKGGIYTVEMFTYASDDTYPFNDSLTTTFYSSDCYWESLPSPGIKNMEHCAIYDPINNLFFILGGDSTGQENFMNICLSFNPETETWDTNTPLPTERRAHRCAYRNGLIHVLCGINELGKTNSHEVYNIELDNWSAKASAPLAVTRPSVAIWKDSLIYLMGGYDVYSNARTEAYYYNPATNSWNTATALPRQLHGGGIEIKGDSIFIIGGADGASFYSEILLGVINPNNPEEISWSWSDSLPNPNTHNLNVMRDNKIYMIGGYYNVGANNDVWEYDRKNKKWKSLPDYPTPSISVGDFAKSGAVFDSSGYIYCFMGNTGGRSTSRSPTDECYKLVKIQYSGIEEEKESKGNSISLKNTICLTNDITINYNITKICDLNINMYDVLGREVFSKVEKDISAGQHQLIIKENLENGIYFIQIKAGQTVAFEKVILIR
jgi:N-acetylneuraminic acid mutarotase